MGITLGIIIGIVSCLIGIICTSLVLKVKKHEVEIEYKNEVQEWEKKILQLNCDYSILIHDNEEKVAKLRQREWTSQKDIELLNNKKEQLQNEIKNELENLQIKKESLLDSLQTIQTSYLSEIKTKILYISKEYKNELYNQVQKDYSDKKLTLEEEYTILLLNKEKLNSEIQELQNSRAAAIAAFKREEEIKDKLAFYTLSLNGCDLADIECLKSIEKYLINKNPLYKLVWSTYYQQPLKDLIGRVLGNDKVSGIYKITNLTNNQCYIGQSVDIGNRWIEHVKSSLGIGTIAHQKIHDVIAKNGINNFTFELLEKCSKEELNSKEKLWIKTYQSDSYGYNMTGGGS